MLRVAPLGVGVVIVVILTALIRALDLFDSLLNRDILTSGNSFSSRLNGAVNEDLDKLRTVRKDIVRATSDYDARSLVRKLANDL